VVALGTQLGADTTGIATSASGSSSSLRRTSATATKPLPAVLVDDRQSAGAQIISECRYLGFVNAFPLGYDRRVA
jgi:hypothetical protein